MGLLIPRRSSAVATSTTASFDSRPLHIITQFANSNGLLVSVACVSMPIHSTGNDPATDGHSRTHGLKLVNAAKRLTKFILEYLKGTTLLKSLLAFGNVPHPS